VKQSASSRAGVDGSTGGVSLACMTRAVSPTADAVKIEINEEVTVAVMERSPSKTSLSAPGWLLV
jgi:hypothetical protein